MRDLITNAETSSLTEKLNFSNYLLNKAEKITRLGHWQWDISTDTLFWSDNLYRIYGLDRAEEISVDRFLDLVYPPDREMVSSHIENFLKTKTFSSFHHRIVTPAGQVKVLQAHGEVQTDREGNPVRMFGTGQDVTDGKNMERELVLKTAALQCKNEELEKFVFVASHDLQEPLRKLAIWCSALKDEYEKELDEKGRTYLEKIVEASKRMRHLVQSILNLSTVSQVTDLSMVDLNKVIHHVLADLSNSIQSSGARLRIASLPTIEANEDHMYQVFQNLLTNAIKFVEQGKAPEIEVTAHLVTTSVQKNDILQDHQKMIAPASGEVDHYCISVTDNGIGFDPLEGSKIFTLFNSLHKQQGYKGHGIGLAVVKKIIENHHGRVNVSSQPGIGTTFTILLPVTQNP